MNEKTGIALDILIKSLFDKKNARSFLELEQIDFSCFFAKDSKCMSSIVNKIIFCEKDSLCLILKSHLYIEILINDIIETEASCNNKYINKKFSNKIRTLNQHNIIDTELFNDIKIINDIRNNFAHNFEYKIYSSKLFTQASIYKDKTPLYIRSYKAKEAYYKIALKYLLFNIIGRIHNQYTYTILLNKDKKRAYYHPLELTKQKIVSEV